MSTCADHTYGPEGYVERAEWGERMVETHVQSACDECHLYLIWTPKDGPCASYTARSWSPTAEAPEDDRCVNCGQSEGLHSGREDDPREAVAPGDERYYRPQKNGSDREPRP